MLYKKYHRNFVRQFKNGTKVKYYIYLSPYTVVHEPYYSTRTHWIEFHTNNSSDPNWILVSSGGSINKEIKIVGENAV